MGEGVTKRPRESGIELFRILLMLSIVACHYVNNSGVFSLCDRGAMDFFSSVSGRGVRLRLIASS